MKRIARYISLSLLFVFMLSLFGCVKTVGTESKSATKTENSKIQLDIESLKANYKDATIKNDLALTTELENGSTVTWQSSNADVVSNKGVINVVNGGLTPTGDLPTVTLTASLKNGDDEVKNAFSFEVTVNKTSKDADTIRQAKAALLNQYEGVELTGFAVNGLDENDNISAYTFSFAAREDVTLTYSDSERLKFDGTVATVKRPTSQECIEGKDYVIENLKVKMVLNDVEVNFEIPLQITKPSPLLTVGKLRTEVMTDPSFVQKQDSYLFRGTVSLVWEHNEETNYQGFFLQDEVGGILIYSASINDACQGVSVGDEVLVTATTCFYNGLAETDKVSAVQILVPSAENTQRYEKLEKISIDANNFNDSTMNMKDNILAEANGLIFDHMTDSNGNPITEIKTTSAVVYFYFRNVKGIPVAVSLDKYTTDYNDIKAEFNALKLGDIVNIDECAISWFSSGVQLKIANKGHVIVDTSATLTANEKFKLDQKHIDALEVKSVFSPGSYDLPTTMPFGSSVSWALETANQNLSIASSKLSITNFTDPFDFTLVATLDSGQAGVDGKEYKFEAKAVNPVDLAAVKAAVDGTTFKANTAVKAKVADLILGGTVAIVTNDGTTLYYCSLPQDAAVKAGDELTVLLSNAVKDGDVYKLYASSVITSLVSQDGFYFIDAASVELANVTSGFKKVELKNVKVENGKAKISDTVTLDLVANKSGNNKQADGTYYNLKGYIMPKEDTTVTFYVLGEVGTDYMIKLDPVNFLGYNGTDNINYANRTISFENTVFYTTELGVYGNGIQMRPKANSSNDPKFGSAIWNIDAINGGIDKIVFEYNAVKKYNSGDIAALVISFGETPECDSETINLDMTETDLVYNIVPENNNYKYFKIELPDSITHSEYWDSITIYLTNAPSE